MSESVKSSGIEEENIYKNKGKELVLALLSDLYSKLDAISINTSSTFFICFILSADYLNY